MWRFKDSAFTSSGFAHRHLLTLLPMVYKDEGDISVWEILQKFEQIDMEYATETMQAATRGTGQDTGLKQA